MKTIAQQVIDRAGLELPTNDASRSLFESSNKMTPSMTSEANIPPLLGVAPLGAVPLQKEHQCQFQMMEAAYFHMPQPADSEKLRSYLPRNQYHTPPYYNQVRSTKRPLLSIVIANICFAGAITSFGHRRILPKAVNGDVVLRFLLHGRHEGSVSCGESAQEAELAVSH